MSAHLRSYARRLGLLVLIYAVAAQPWLALGARAASVASALGFTSKISADLVAESALDQWPENARTLTLDRLTLPAGGAVPQHATDAAELILVESGKLAFTDELGISGSYGPGDSLLIPSGGSYGVSNATSDAATVLRLAVGPGAPPDEENGDLVVDKLFQGEVSGPPGGTITIFLMTATWASKARTQARFDCGPIVVAAEAGALSIVQESETSLVNEGAAELLPPNGAHRIEDAGKQSASAIVAGAISADEGACLPPPSATATPKPKPTAKPQPTRTVGPTSPSIVPGGPPPNS
jgi:quercetin dioxygenase-like cupin family protein